MNKLRKELNKRLQRLEKATDVNGYRDTTPGQKRAFTFAMKALVRFCEANGISYPFAIEGRVRPLPKSNPAHVNFNRADWRVR